MSKMEVPHLSVHLSRTTRCLPGNQRRSGSRCLPRNCTTKFVSPGERTQRTGTKCVWSFSGFLKSADRINRSDWLRWIAPDKGKKGNNRLWFWGEIVTWITGCGCSDAAVHRRTDFYVDWSLKRKENVHFFHPSVLEFLIGRITSAADVSHFNIGFPFNFQLF